MFAFIKYKFWLIVLLIMGFSNSFGQSKTYVKNYFENGQIESEGWTKNNQKVDYWFYYYENGNKKEEGHYLDNKKTKWWLSYDDKEVLQKKCQFANNQLEGICVIYKNGNIIRAEKYKMNIKIKQWESLSAYRKDNTLTSL
jgi:antitoxin component YwqK of YwqJK toxin-antitoxin module